MRLIDADALMKQIESPYTEYPIMIHLRRAIKDFIDSAPTIDAVSVVRCKDCRWSEPNEFDDYDCRCHVPIFRVNADDYCSYGERKESE